MIDTINKQLMTIFFFHTKASARQSAKNVIKNNYFKNMVPLEM